MSENKIRAPKRICRLLLPISCLPFAMALTLPVRAQVNVAVHSPGTPSKVLSQLVQRVVFDSSAFHGPSMPAPYSDKGYLITHIVESFVPGTSNIVLYDRSGQKVREAAIWFPQSTRVAITSAAVTSDGRIVASGEADKADGTRAPFIVLTDLSGKVKEVVQTKDFYPRNVCVAPDNTVWSFGGTWWDEANEHPLPGDVLRHFDFEKGQLAAYIPRSTFPDNSSYDGLTEMRCSANEVAVYSRAVNTYIVMPYGGSVPNLYDAPPPSGLTMTGFASFGSKNAYGVFINRQRMDDPIQGLYSLELDESAKTVRWVAVEGALGSRKSSGTVLRLWGADGEFLVLGRAQDPAGLTALHWAAVSEK
jgi:hypothetical protein